MDEVFGYLQKLQADMLEQFRGKPNSEVLLAAISRQLQEVHDFFVELWGLRTFDNAVGVQLDGLGDIVVLTRQEAAALAGRFKPDVVMDDELYREYLRYKVLLNTNNGTYPDVHKALKFFWDRSPLYYYEDPAYPATMIFYTPLLRPEDNAADLLQIPRVKAAGVTLILVARTESETVGDTLRVGGAAWPAISETTLPAINWEYSAEHTIRIAARGESIMETRLPEIQGG